MKILYFISVQSQGLGGHYRSLDHIAGKVAEKNEVSIISIGPSASPVIQNSPHFLHHLYFDGLNILALLLRIRKISGAYGPDVFHCFDELSYNIVRLAVSSRKNKLLLTICGGENRKRLPHAGNLILFSEENFNWYRRAQTHRKSSLTLIPNRVRALVDCKPVAPKPHDAFVFMRICRIGPAYRKSILDSLELIRTLQAESVGPVKLYLVGSVEDPKLKSMLDDDPLTREGSVRLYTDPDSTLEAWKMLVLADAVIGTGRGLMEAASLSLPVLAIDSRGKLPVLLDEHNFRYAFATNFSQRNVFPEDAVLSNLTRIRRLVLDKDFHDASRNFSRAMFDRFFNVDLVGDAYQQVYANAATGRRFLLKDLKMTVRSFLHLFKHHRIRAMHRQISGF